MFDNKEIKVGIAPIAWTNDDMPDLGGKNTFEQCISEAALAGYGGTEIGNKYPKEVDVLKKALDLRGISIAGAWFSAFLTTRPYAETEAAFIAQRDFLHALGARVIVVSEQGHSVQGQMDTPVFQGKYSMDDSEWQALCEGLEELGRLANEKGIALCYHHHMGTVVQNEDEIDRLMENTDPTLVNLLYDTGHLVYSGGDALAVLEKHASRVRHVHLKDIRPAIVQQVRDEKLSFLQGVRLGAFTVPGDGAINFEPVFSALDRAGYEGWLLVEAEQDPDIANPFEYALKARSYIRTKAGV